VTAPYPGKTVYAGVSPAKFCHCEEFRQLAERRSNLLKIAALLLTMTHRSPRTASSRWQTMPITPSSDRGCYLPPPAVCFCLWCGGGGAALSAGITWRHPFPGDPHNHEWSPE